MERPFDWTAVFAWRCFEKISSWLGLLVPPFAAYSIESYVQFYSETTSMTVISGGHNNRRGGCVPSPRLVYNKKEVSSSLLIRCIPCAHCHFLRHKELSTGLLGPTWQAERTTWPSWRRRPSRATSDPG